MNITDQKEALRREMRTRRAALSAEDRRAANERLIGNVLATAQWRNARTVLAFVGVRTEPDTAPLINAALAGGKRVALPRVAGSDLLVLEAGDEFEVSPFGIPEPLLTASRVEPTEIDLVIVPGLAFGSTGHRVGYGAGFYDRFLPQLRSDATSIGICFQFQRIDQVPHDRHDHPVDHVVTDLLGVLA